MSSNSFHDFINLDVVHYFFELARRITTMSDKIHVTELNHFIKLFSYSIQNRDSFQTFDIRLCMFLFSTNAQSFDVKNFDK